MANTIKCFQITLTGKLRGRGLRFSTMYMAFPLNITGFVEYTGSGGIMIEAEGVEEDLEQFISGLRSLVLAFKISDISISETAPKGYSSFEIRYGTNLDDTAVNRPFAFRYLLFLWMRMRRMFGLKKHPILTHKNKHANYS
ncbi:MAG: acylphosphatase [Prolixibacteraceae bacterium]